ncbi:hypothetical protein [Lacipirellula parvula]|uniref:Uncharacterized protein n=1 Tax=Lacipirellula parvula TaxID=2650471 RepID=A0A5K7XLV5_9BACT|nr:hypothetical protein [Lacipirellula parvula]BBO36351.1 hypothetical protein PLANPX_5963 [Lacipirellula parvula]
MPILIGVDEAGYGPNYGPLAIAATAWRVAERLEARGQKPEKNKKRAGGFIPPVLAPSLPAIDLYKLLKKSVVRSPQECPKRIAIADSKQLYKPGLGIRHLERGVLAALINTSPTTQQKCVERVEQLLAATLADPHSRRHELACHAGDDQQLPLDAIAEEICTAAALFREVAAANGVALLTIRAKLIYPAEFNDLVDKHGTKGAVLSHLTLELVRETVDAALMNGGINPPARNQSNLPARQSGIASARKQPKSQATLFPPEPRTPTPTTSRTLRPEPCHLTLDKHGGRNRYAAILQHHFPDSWIETLDEGRAASRYRWTHRDAPIEATFRVGGEEQLPTALASMTAKYHRELAMRAFNDFWTTRLPGLKPTAGYPNDAKRFRAEIEHLQRELKIDDRLIWRNR